MLSANPQLSKSPVRKHVSRQIFNHNIVNLALSLSILIYFNFPAPLVPGPIIVKNRAALSRQSVRTEKSSKTPMKTLARLHKNTKEREKLCLNYIRFTQSYQLARGWLRVVVMSQDDVFLFRAIQSWNSYNKCVCVRVEFQFVLEFKLQLDPCSWLPGAKFSFWFIKLVLFWASKLSPPRKGFATWDRSRHNFSPIWIISFDCYSFDF